MNSLDFTSGLKEAQLRYLDGDYKVVRPGSFVRCAITGQIIPMADLKYWSVERQEAYADAAAALEAFRRSSGSISG